MNILFIIDEYSVGGAAKALGEVAIELKKRKINLIVCTSHYDKFNEFLTNNNIKNITDGHLGVMDVSRKGSFLKPRILKYIKGYINYHMARYRAVRLIQKKVELSKIDVIHTNSARNDIGCLLYEKYGIPHVMHLREFGKEDFDCWIYRKDYYSYLNRTCTSIVAVTDAVRKSWISKGISSDICKTLYDGVDFTKIIKKEKYNIDSKELRVVMVGGICETKGQHIAIEAIAQLPAQVKQNVVCDIVGWYDPVYLDSLKRRIEEFGLEQQIKFLGERDDVGGLLNKYDVGLMCSKSEGFGRVTVEYMYAGLTVVASSTGGTPELVTDGYTGFLFDRDHPEMLSAHLDKIYNDRSILLELGKNAHIEAKKRFSSKRNADDITELYGNILKMGANGLDEKNRNSNFSSS